MERGKARDRMIEMTTNGERIKLGENYAIAVYEGSKITWKWETGNYPFAIQFGPKVPLLPAKDKAISIVIDEVASEPYLPVKYTIAAFVDGKVLILDPVLVRIPPSD